MMIEIYFDDVLIDSDYYAGISNEFKLFDETFMLGTTTSNTFNIVVPLNCVETIPINVVIKENDNVYATLIVDNYEIQDNNMLSLTLTDKMTLFNFDYDASLIVPCTTKNILENICYQVGVELGTTDFINDDIIVNYCDNTITAREYIGMIAELNGGYAVIGQDGKLYLKQFDEIRSIIDTDECEDFKIGNYHQIERVVFDNGLLKFETSTDESLETLYLNNENVFINDENVFNNIAEVIIGFEFYSFEIGNCPIDSSLQAGDLIKFTDGVNEYVTIAQYDIDYNGAWIGGYSLNINSKHQEETKQKGKNDVIKAIKVKLDRDKNILDIAVQDIDDNKVEIANLNIKSNEIEQSVSSLNNSVTQIQTDTYTKTQIDTKLIDGSVTKVQTTTGTFDENGVFYEKSNAKTNIRVGFEDDNEGLMLKDKRGNIEENILFAGYDNEIGGTVVKSKDIKVEKYLVIGTHSRIEDYEDGTGIFYL